jgi:hypothetical protein
LVKEQKNNQIPGNWFEEEIFSDSKANGVLASGQRGSKK